MKHNDLLHPSQPPTETNAGELCVSITRRRFAIAALSATAGLLLPRDSFSLAPQPAPRPTPATVPNIVLVHGAFADGSSWSRVILLLEAKGFNVTAVQNPLNSLADDVATTRRLLAQQTGPTILVGHSYAGFVITEAGNAPNVAGLVYISSYGPAEGESHDDLVKRYAAPPGISAVRLDEDGYLWIRREKYHEAFAQDVDLPQARIMAAVQKPVSKKNCFGAPISAPAWKSKPSWFLVSTDDHMINPELQRFMAKRMGATIASVPSSHASLVSHPMETANLIAEAAGHKASGGN
jgi:pimeloyl-ACP methyl ester carboxylesterase